MHRLVGSTYHSPLILLRLHTRITVHAQTAAQPLKNDFNETANKILNEFGLTQTMNEIKNMKKNVFKSIVKRKSLEAAFEYLVTKQMNGSKGRDIQYSCMYMADYLLPQAGISLEDQNELFSLRCRTNKMGANRGIVEWCFTQCGEILNNAHIFKCKILNENDQFDIDKILNGLIAEKKEHLKKWRENMQKLQ